jgi:iron complex transport system ATP-binding protein
MIEFKNIHATYNGNPVLKGISLSIGRGEKWAILGKNGAGKSTLIKLLAGILTPTEGSIHLNGVNLQKMVGRERAKWIAYMPQRSPTNIPYSVHDFIMLGRHSYQGVLAIATSEDRMAVGKSMELCDVAYLKNRMMTTLSGGELQRVLLAGAVVQNAQVLILDEPTTFLDPSHEQYFYESLDRLYIENKLTWIMVSHDLNAILERSSHICVLNSGSLFYSGKKDEFSLACPQILTEIFSIEFQQYHSAKNGLTIYRPGNFPTSGRSESL